MSGAVILEVHKARATIIVLPTGTRDVEEAWFLVSQAIKEPLHYLVRPSPDKENVEASRLMAHLFRLE